MAWYLQIDGKMACRTNEDAMCCLGYDQEVAEHEAQQYAAKLPERDVKAVELDYCPAEAEDHAAFMEHVEANDPQARERALCERLDEVEPRLNLALAVLADIEWGDVGDDERRCPACGAGERQDGHRRECGLHKALRGESGRH